MGDRRNGTKVFGIGLSKTGTTSLAEALNVVGIRTVHFPNDERTHAELTNGRYRLSVLQDHDGAVDIPIAPFYAQLDAAYPGSKFILTVRQKEAWLHSAELHWSRREESRGGRDRIPEGFSEGIGFLEFIDAATYGSLWFSRERFSFVYDTHVGNVRRYFAGRPDDLLVMDICAGEGWEKLCPFLGVAHPTIPFPHENAAPPRGDGRGDPTA